METQISEKSRLTAFLLSWFLGVFGAHQFYVGKTRQGVIMLLMSISVFLLIISIVWNFVDWIVILTGGFKDEQGRVVKNW